MHQFKTFTSLPMGSTSLRSDRVLQLLESGHFADIRILIDDKVFKCHKMTLMCASEFFEKLLLTDCKETSSGEIHLQNVTPNTFEIFRQFVYCLDPKPLHKLNTTELLQVLECADMWLTPALVEVCTALLIGRSNSMPVGPLVVMFGKAHSMHNAKLKEAAIKNLKKPGMNLNCPESTELPANCIKEYVKLISSLLNEVRRFELIEKWIYLSGYNKPGMLYPSIDNRIDLIDELLKEINYDKMSVSEFYNGPGKSKLLKESWKLDKLFALVDGNQKNGRYCHYCGRC